MFDPASFGKTAPDPDAYRLLSYLPPPKGWKKTDENTENEPTIAEKQAA